MKSDIRSDLSSDRRRSQTAPAVALHRIKSLTDSECQKAYTFAEDMDCIRRYDRHFLRPLEIGS